MKTRINTIVDVAAGSNAESLSSLRSLWWQLQPDDSLTLSTIAGNVEAAECMLQQFQQLHEKNCGVVAYPDGSSKANRRNIAWKAADAEWVWFIDPGEMLAPFALGSLRQVAEKSPDSQIISGAVMKVLNDDAGTLWNYTQYQLQSSVFPPGRLAHLPLRRHCLEQIAGFSDTVTDEVIDLFRKIREAYGLTAFGSCDSIFAYHRVSLPSGAKNAPRKKISHKKVKLADADVGATMPGIDSCMDVLNSARANK